MVSHEQVQAVDEPRRAPPRPKGRGAWTALIIVAVGIAGAGAAWPWLQHRLATPPETWLGSGASHSAAPDRVAELSARLQALEGVIVPLAQRLDLAERRLSQLDGELGKVAAERKGPDTVEPDHAQLVRLAEDMAKLNEEFQGIRRMWADEGGTLRLTGAVEKAEAAFRRIAAQRDKTPLFLAALGQLREAVDRGGPYLVELQAANALADKGATARLAVLANSAGPGVASRAALAEAFKPAVAAAFRAAAAAEGGGLPPILRRAVGTVVTITRADGRDDGIYGPIAQAGRMLAAGDLGGAVIVLRNVDGPGAAELVPWLEAAEARLAVDGAMSEMTAQAIAKAGSHDE